MQVTILFSDGPIGVVPVVIYGSCHSLQASAAMTRYDKLIIMIGPHVFYHSVYHMTDDPSDLIGFPANNE
jgi:hypothetical protein